MRVGRNLIKSRRYWWCHLYTIWFHPRLPIFGLPSNINYRTLARPSNSQTDSCELFFPQKTMFSLFLHLEKLKKWEMIDAIRVKRCVTVLGKRWISFSRELLLRRNDVCLHVLSQYIRQSGLPSDVNDRSFCFLLLAFGKFDKVFVCAVGFFTRSPEVSTRYQFRN